MRILDKTVNKRDQKDGDRLGFNWIFTGRNISTIPVMAVQLRINKTKNVGKTILVLRAETLLSAAPYRTVDWER